MATHVDVLRQALGLCAEDRASLAAELLDSLGDHGFEDPDVAEAWKAELSRRYADYKAGRVETSTWDEVNALLVEAESQHAG